jgi:hypothetical protein
MNIKCSFCQMPYALSRMQMLDALQEMDAHKHSHYDAHCPRCRRATRVERKRMEMFFPNWREALKQFEAEMKAVPALAAESKPVAEPAAKKPAPKAKPAANPAASKATAKPVAKASPAKAKPAATSKAKAPAKKKK